MNDPALLAALQVLAQKLTDLPDNIILANAKQEQDINDGGLLPIYDKPQPVIIMGPKPLPVSGMGGPTATKEEPKKKKAEEEPKSPSPWQTSMPAGFSAVLSKFAAVAGPMAILGQVLGSVTSGFGVVIKSTQLLAGAMAPVLLPVTVLLATAFTAVAEILTGAGMPVMQGFFGLILGVGIPAVVAFSAALRYAVGWIMEFAEWASRRKEGTGEGIAFNAASALIAPSATALKLADRTWGAASGRKPNEKDPTTQLVFESLKDVTKSLALSVGPRAQISGLEGVGKAAQLAALNNDPIEQRMLETQLKILAKFEAALAGLGGGGGGVYTPEAEGFWNRVMGG